MFTLEQATKGQKGSRGITISLTSALDRGGCSTARLDRFTLRKDPILIVWEVGWAAGPDWTGVEKLASTGIRSLDRPDRSQSLYRLSQPGPRRQIQYNLKKCYTHHTDLTSEPSICINAFCIETLILGQVCGSPFSRFHEVTSEI